LGKNAILIIGDNALQNELVASYLEKETDAKCLAQDDLCKAESDFPGEKCWQWMLLFDCSRKAITDGPFQECAPLLQKTEGAGLLCLFNIDRGLGVESGLLSQGVRGFFYNGEPLQNLAKGVKAVFNGEFWVPRRFMGEFLKNQLHKVNKGSDGLLTRRETEVLALLMTDATNLQIAEKLAISRHTVKTHLSRIFKKINFRSRAQAAYWADRYLCNRHR
jgi:LuxR family transcriptional regulator, positive regulator of biofilm formation